MLQLDGFPTGDGVKVKRNKKTIVSPPFHFVSDETFSCPAS